MDTASSLFGARSERSLEPEGLEHPIEPAMVVAIAGGGVAVAPIAPPTAAVVPSGAASGRFHQPPPKAWNNAAVSVNRLARACIADMTAC